MVFLKIFLKNLWFFKILKAVISGRFSVDKLPEGASLLKICKICFRIFKNTSACKPESRCLKRRKTPPKQTISLFRRLNTLKRLKNEQGWSSKVQCPIQDGKDGKSGSFRRITAVQIWKEKSYTHESFWSPVLKLSPVCEVLSKTRQHMSA